MEGAEWGRAPGAVVHWSESVPSRPPAAPAPRPSPPQFEEIHEVIARYKTLVSMHQDLMQSAQEGQEKVERAKAQLARYKEEKDDEILQHNNELARLQMRFDRARSDVIIWVSAPGWVGKGHTNTHTHTHTHRRTHTLSPSAHAPPSFSSPGISLGTHPEHRRQEDPLAWYH